MKFCLVCECEIAYDHYPNDATTWRSNGSAGSVLYDSPTKDIFLECFICDKCLVKKVKLVEEVRVKVRKDFIRREPNFEED